MKDTEKLRLLYQDSEAFKAGIEVGRKEIIDKSCKWLKFNTNWGDKWDNMRRNLDFGKIDEFRKAMEE